MTDLDLALAAGLFEGEGTVRISRPQPRNWGHLDVSLVNTDREIVDFFQSRWPARVRLATGLRPAQRQAYVWTIAARQAAAFLEDVRPYVLTTRMKERIRHGLAFQAQKRMGAGPRTQEYCEDQWNAYWWMAELNKRGRSLAEQQQPREVSPL